NTLGRRECDPEDAIGAGLALIRDARMRHRNGGRLPSTRIALQPPRCVDVVDVRRRCPSSIDTRRAEPIPPPRSRVDQGEVITLTQTVASSDHLLEVRRSAREAVPEETPVRGDPVVIRT